MPSPAAVDLTDAVRAFLAQPLIATIASLDEDGAPRQAAVWYRLDDDGRILLNSRAGRRWCDNLERDGRVSIAVIDPEDGYRSPLHSDLDLTTGLLVHLPPWGGCRVIPLNLDLGWQAAQLAATVHHEVRKWKPADLIRQEVTA